MDILTEEKEQKNDYNKYSVQQIEDEIMSFQDKLSGQENDLNELRIDISNKEKEIIDLKISCNKARLNINNTKVNISNLEKIFKWRSVHKENGK